MRLVRAIRWDAAIQDEQDGAAAAVMANNLAIGNGDRDAGVAGVIVDSSETVRSADAAATIAFNSSTPSRLSQDGQVTCLVPCVVYPVFCSW